LITTAELSLDVESTRCLPAVVSPGEEGDAARVQLINRLEGNSLLLLTGDSSTVCLTSVGPSSLEDNDILGATAVGLGEGHLFLDERTGFFWGDCRVEEWMNVDSDNVHVLADVILDGVENVDGLGSGDLSLVTGATDLLSDLCHVGCEFGTSAEAVEDRLVTDDEKLDATPLTPLDDVLDLRVGSRDTSSLDEDTEDDLEVVLLAGAADRLESTAIGRVKTNGLEALGGDGLDVSINVRSSLARLVIIVW